MPTKRVGWFKLRTRDVLRSGFADRENLARIKLAAWLVDRSARDWLEPEDACKAALSSGTLTEVTGRSHRAKQLEVLERIAEVEGISIEDRGDFVWIEWPKFLEWLPMKAREAGPSRSHSDAEADTHAQAEADTGRNGIEEKNYKDAAASFRADPPAAAPYRKFVPKVLRECWPELDGEALECLSCTTWAAYQGSDAHFRSEGFGPFLARCWNELGLPRPPDA